MPLQLGSTTIGSLYLGSTKIAEAWRGNVKVYGASAPGPVLPAYTIRLKYTEGVTPTFTYGTATQVSSSPNVWDLTYESPYNTWNSLLQNHTGLIEVLDANTTGITEMVSMFYGCSNLTAVALFDTSSVITMSGAFFGCESLTTIPQFNTSSVTSMATMLKNCYALTSVPLLNTANVRNMTDAFYQCRSLTNIPLFDTSRVTSMSYTFYGCTNLAAIPLLDTSVVSDFGFAFCECVNVQSGALALYNQASTQSTPPSYYTAAFSLCGSQTVTGAAELAQIPASWGGRAP